MPAIASYAYAALFCVAVYYFYTRKFRRGRLADLPGPEPQSFLLGNLRELFQEQVGSADFRWQEQYGNTVHIKSTLGSDVLWIADVKALQHIYHASGYDYPKWRARRALARLHSGHGLVWADGETHQRQRKVMSPAFGAPESRALFPILNHSAEAVTLKWKDLLFCSSSDAVALDVSEWLSRATLDAIGEAAFDYRVGAMEDNNSELARGYNNLMSIAFSSPSATKVFAMDVARFIPLSVTEWLQDNLNGRGLQKARECAEISTKVAKELVDSKAKFIAEGKGHRDILSLLVKANASQDANARLTDEEMLAEMRTILFAGHETTSNTIGLVLLELARNPDIQTRLRKEIHEMRNTIRGRGDTEFTAADLEVMPLTQAVIKETLRMHPVVPHAFRFPLQDDVIPLARPVVTKSGESLTHLPVAKGTRIILSIAAYQRDADVWGCNPHTFDPNRWLDGRVTKSHAIGAYSNLLTFAGGVRSCIGYRLAVHEIQAFIVELVSNFEFTATDATRRIRREPCAIMQPTVEGEVEKGTQLPLQISLATQDE